MHDEMSLSGTGLLEMIGENCDVPRHDSHNRVNYVFMRRMEPSLLGKKKHYDCAKPGAGYKIACQLTTI
jgi:hypothetical protein